MTFLEQMNAELVRLQKRQAILLDLITAYGEPDYGRNRRVELRWREGIGLCWCYKDSLQLYIGDYVLGNLEIAAFNKQTGYTLNINEAKIWNKSTIEKLNEWKNKQL